MKNITNQFKVSGVYCIINIKNHKRYIGSSKNIKYRLQSHRSNLRHNNHENQYLQNAWNKYGEDNFDFYIIEKCEESQLLDKEQNYISNIKPEYNLNPITQKPPCTENSRRKQSETRKKLFSEGKLKPSFKHIPTYVYDLDGNFLKEYYSIKSASLGEFGKNSGAVRGACYGLENPQHRVHNRLFYLEKLSKVPAWNRDNIQKPNSRKTYNVKEGSTIKQFKGLDEVAKYLKTTSKNLRQYVGKNLKYKRKYMIYKNVPCN